MLTASVCPVPGCHRAPLYNTVIWLLDGEGDRPYRLASSVAPASRRGDIIPQSRTDLALLGYALSRGWFMRNLLQAQHTQSCPVQIVHGAGKEKNDI